ncbi:immunoglobulin superfamily member 21-like [Leptidea sinapis]|uniref:immunoglobulin superfamily member 21-like n=1 Tax=Leptidea sinapis TaxID=189913 RepID=UPI0021C4C352|nr:immunoglobulin superfamily member 21-like [Leptidea sinapis]
MADCFGGKLMVMLLLTFKCSCLRTRALTNEDSVDFVPVSTTEVEGVVGRRALLPCDVEPDLHEDRVYMVLWFRHAGGKPLYSFDVRGRSFHKALHWSDPLAFGARAHFVSTSRPASLAVDAVQLDDEGIYRCRVDFKNSPTRNFQIRLKVIVPPHQLLLYDEGGRDVAGVVGPLEEHGNFTLLCELRGGRPQPTLSWLMNESPLPHVVLKHEPALVVSRVSVTGVQRAWLNRTVRCRARNTALLSPHERSARIEINLRPTSVSILEKPVKLSADTEVTLECVAHGSRPAAQISWYRENRRYTRGKHSEFINETSSISKLSMMPQPEDDGATIRCRADNPVLRVALEDSFRMSVVYKPVVSMTLGSTLNANDIKEGDDVYFECNIRANPKEHRITWYHNEQQVIQNVTGGVFISTKSLVMQRVSRNDGGLYSCSAANHRGETSSQPVYLRVQYAPICVQPTPVVIGARLDEALRVRCLVSADPADLTFSWQFNNSGESFQVSPARYARPSPPRNCSASRVMHEQRWWMSVRCIAGYDGGLAQHFTLDAVGATPRALANTTASNDLVVWLNVSWADVEGISEDEILSISARNSKGASDPVLLTELVYKDAAKQTEETARAVSRFPVVAACGAVAAVLAALGAVLALLLKKRHESSGSSKRPRPCQSVVQVDDQGRLRRCLVPHSVPSPHTKPDILNPKHEGDPPRVVLESDDSKVYNVKEVTGAGDSTTYMSPANEDEMMPQR